MSSGALNKPSPPSLSDEEDRSTKKVKNRHDDVNTGMAFDEGVTTSFRDVLTKQGGLREDDDFFPIDVEVDDDEVVIEKVDPNTLRLGFSDRVNDLLCEAMKNTVMIKMLGRGISITTLENRLRELWKLAGGFNIMDLENGYFMVRVSTHADYMKILLGGPWVILGHYLTVQPWTPNFDTSAQYVSAVATWVRFPGLPAKYYHKNVLRKIGGALGMVLRIDYNTSASKRGQFARMGIILDLEKPLITSMEIEGRHQRLEYESLPFICYRCGCYGHVIDKCKLPVREAVNVGNVGEETSAGMPTENSSVPAPTTMPNAAGPWIHAVRRSRIPRQGDPGTNIQKVNKVEKGTAPKPKESDKPAGQSRYGVLACMENELDGVETNTNEMMVEYTFANATSNKTKGQSSRSSNASSKLSGPTFKKPTYEPVKPTRKSPRSACERKENVDPNALDLNSTVETFDVEMTSVTKAAPTACASASHEAQCRSNSSSKTKDPEVNIGVPTMSILDPEHHSVVVLSPPSIPKRSTSGGRLPDKSKAIRLKNDLKFKCKASKGKKAAIGFDVSEFSASTDVDDFYTDIEDE